MREREEGAKKRERARAGGRGGIGKSSRSRGGLVTYGIVRYGLAWWWSSMGY